MKVTRYRLISAEPYPFLKGITLGEVYERPSNDVVVKKEDTEFEALLRKYWERLELNKQSYILLKNRNKL